VVKATMMGLQQLQSRQEIAARRGKSAEELA
jgi:ribosomal protein S5